MWSRNGILFNRPNSLLVIIFHIFFSTTTTAPVIYTPTDSTLDANDFEKWISSQIQQGHSDLAVAPGTYTAKPINTESHFSFSNLRDVHIDGHGVVVLLPERSLSVVIFYQCTNIFFSGFFFRHSIPPFTQGKITAIAADGSSYDVRVADGYPVEDLKGTPTGYVFDPVTRSWSPRCYDLYAKSVRQNSQNEFTLFWNGNLGPSVHNVHVGDLMAFRGDVRADFHLYNSANMTLEDITIQNAVGFVYFESGGYGNHTYRHCVIERSPVPPSGATETPLIASNADGLHSAQVQHGPTVEDCYFEYMPDDGIAIHGSYGIVAGAAKSTMNVTDILFEVGNIVMVYDTLFRPAGNFLITSVVRLPNFKPPQNQSKTIPRFDIANAQWVQLTLDGTFDADFDFIASNSFRTGNGFFLQNNTMFRNRARGFLIKASHGQIVDNLLDGSSMYGMEIAPELYWTKADFAHDLLIKNNVIRNVAWHIQQGAGIMVGAYDPNNNLVSGFGHSQITIQGNSIENVNITNLFLSSIDTVVVENNKFVSPFHAAPYNPNQVASSIVFMNELHANQASQNCFYDIGSYATKPPVTLTATVQNNVVAGFTQCTQKIKG